MRLAEAGYRTARIGKFHVAPEAVFAFQTVLSGGKANDPATIGRSPMEMAERSRTRFCRMANPPSTPGPIRISSAIARRATRVSRR